MIAMLTRQLKTVYENSCIYLMMNRFECQLGRLNRSLDDNVKLQPNTGFPLFDLFRGSIEVKIHKIHKITFISVNFRSILFFSRNITQRL